MTATNIDRKTTLNLIAQALYLGYTMESGNGRWNPENNYWTRLGIVCFQKMGTDWFTSETWDTKKWVPIPTAEFRTGSQRHLAILRALANVAEHANDLSMRAALNAG